MMRIAITIHVTITVSVMGIAKPATRSVKTVLNSKAAIKRSPKFIFDVPNKIESFLILFLFSNRGKPTAVSSNMPSGSSPELTINPLITRLVEVPIRVTELAKMLANARGIV